MCTRVFCSYVHSMNHTYAYLRDDHKIKFRMVSAQHFINEAPGLLGCSGGEVLLSNSEGNAVDSGTRHVKHSGDHSV